MNDFKREKAEKMAFKHASDLVKEYRKENAALKDIVLIEAIVFGVLLWMMKK